ncbi:transmembrane transporter [Ascochyta rabiei]|uniref:Transmembrane transporter n=1 Tax=Didymella rabiei TaxID=5454 RepID=A0A162ZKD4_DIDRA|nr:transmembrane transporter [Ascochyta rabiei]
MWGSFGCGFSMLMIAVLLSFQQRGSDDPVAKATASASVAFFFTYMLSFGATMNCIPWVYVPEILPLHVRAKGTAVGISANWLWNFFVVMITPTFIPLVFFCYPETANLSLEEVDWLFYEGGAVAKSRRVRKFGWEAEDGAVLEQGSGGSVGSNKEEGEVGTEKREHGSA